jgi:hypothetical protein
MLPVANDIIFGRYFTASQTSDGARQTGLNNGPNGYHNWAGNTPIGLLVDDYQMMDGTAFSWTNPTHKANPLCEPRSTFLRDCDV